MKRKLLAITVGLFASQMAWADWSDDEVSLYTPQQEAEFNRRVEAALVNNPEILKSAIIALQNQEQNKAKAQQGSNLEKNQAALFKQAMDPWIGAENPALTVAYFGDFNCGYCKKIEPILAKLVAQYPQVRVVFKMVPVLGPVSKEATELALTVWQNEPEKFGPLHNAIMAQPGRLDSKGLLAIAKTTDTDQWLNKSSQEVATAITKNMDLMREFGLSGTPSLIFADQVVGGLVPYDQLEKQVQQALQAKS